MQRSLPQREFAAGRPGRDDGAARFGVGRHSPVVYGQRKRNVHYLLMYDVVGDYVQRRAPFRPAHLAHARASIARGELVLGGALADPPDGAVLLFRGESPAAAEAFAASDPYVLNGLVTRWRVRAWTTVVGRDAEVPLPPEPA